MDETMNARANGSPSSAAVVPASLFRDAMSRVAASVHVVTTGGAHGECGFTATSVCSVTDDPPMVLVCLNQASGMHAAFEGNGVFCVNTLGTDQQDLAELFGGRGGVGMDDRFADPRWKVGELGAPILKDALVGIECEVERVQVVGTHYVIFGRVTTVAMAAGNAALVYFGRDYHALAAGGRSD
jgi:flavin reductase (DIM6/NTAB) family NADH-FMN oxidoreductase RutF